jgi:hypothetical protein
MYTENEIAHILKLYKQNREKDKAKYDKVKDNEEFKLKNRQRAKEHYYKNKEMKKINYQKDKEYIKFRNSYNYYKKLDRIDDFKNKYPERYSLLIERGYVIQEGL